MLQNYEVMFETFGYHEDFQVGGKYIGSVNAKYNEERGKGYYSRRTFVLEEDIVVKKSKKEITIKAGTQVTSTIIPLNGKHIKE